MRRDGSRRSPWVTGIVVGLGFVVLWNVFFVYVALTNPDPIAPSYVTEPR
jgi:lipopolysaccharide export LptBFGC system permease protein LptF